MKIKRGLGVAVGLGMGLVAAAYARQALKQAKATCPPFRKRTFVSSGELIESVRPLWLDPSLLRSVRHNAEIDDLFAERMMLVVTGVNGCRYCSYAHQRYAQGLGLEQREIEALLGGQLGEVTVREAPALFFAAQYAELGDEPDVAMVESLYDYYGEDTARDILTYLRLITVANLTGNTLDALISRVLGKPSPETTLWNEVSTLALFAFGLAPLAPVMVMRAMFAV